eukprot:sb/3478938/
MHNSRWLVSLTPSASEMELTQRCRLSPLKKGRVFHELLRTIHWMDLHPACFLRLQIDPSLLVNTREVCLSTGSGSKLTLKLNLTLDFPEILPHSHMV